MGHINAFPFQAYINCSLGIDSIGTVMICYGVTTVIGAACLGYMSKHIKRFPIMSAGTELVFYIILF